MRSLCVVMLAGLALSCAGARGLGTSDVLSGLPPRHDPPLDLTDDEDLARARALYDAMPLEDAARAARRRELAAAYSQRITALSATPAAAFTRFQTALGLWDARELADTSKPAPDLGLLAGHADTIFHRASTSGEDIDAVTALAVLRAAQPERSAQLDKTWSDILAYTNDLAVAEWGPGAERSRAILALESVTAAFPSRWAGDVLVKLYLERQEMVSKAIASRSKQEVVGIHHDPGVLRPAWNVVRAYARMRRLDEAPPLVDKLAGQFGDEPELRKRLAAVLSGPTAADGKSWLALMAAYVPTENGGEGDPAAALLICEEGAVRLPKSLETRKCAAEIARMTDRVPLALRWIREARAIAPADRDSAEILGRLTIMRLGDLLAAERLDAARGVVDEAEAFYAQAQKQITGKPLETSFADVLLTYGRGLYAQGEVDQAVRVLERARKLEDGPDVTEELATIAMKSGRYADARRGYLAAAEAPRQTPIETTFDQNRLRRLAGDAAELAGDRPGAQALWKQALTSWTEAIGAALPPRARTLAFSEMGRLYYALGDTGKAMQAFNAAVDTDPDQTAVYGDIIAFLATRGHGAEALDAYHRAMGRDEVTEYLKAYTSLWMVDLARMTGSQPDGAAVEFLSSIADGQKWYHLLARFKLGKMTFDQLRAKADTRGKRAEAWFYQATARYAAGDRRGAEGLLRGVIATGMLGFFEYDMARYYLQFGPPGQARARERSSRPPGTRDRRPASVDRLRARPLPAKLAACTAR